jgi:hypothetical protein
VGGGGGGGGVQVSMHREHGGDLVGWRVYACVRGYECVFASVCVRMCDTYKVGTSLISN